MSSMSKNCSLSDSIVAATIYALSAAGKAEIGDGVVVARAVVVAVARRREALAIGRIVVGTGGRDGGRLAVSRKVLGV